MNSFRDNQSTERESRRLIEPMLHFASFEARFTTTDGNLTLQKYFGDYIAQSDSSQCKLIELKCETENRYGNFFIETWSNRKQSNLGWIHKLRCDYLWYVFLAEKRFYSIDFPKLKHWFLVCENWNRFEEKRQKKHNQLNDTWGFVVPIRVLEDEIGILSTNLSDDPRENARFVQNKLFAETLAT